MKPVMSGKLSPIAGCLLALAIGMPAGAREFHVSPTGADTNDGSPEKTLQTISEAAKRAQPGDTITVHEDIYRTGRGIWLDWMTQGTHVTRNLVHDTYPGPFSAPTGEKKSTKVRPIKR